MGGDGSCGLTLRSCSIIKYYRSFPRKSIFLVRVVSPNVGSVIEDDRKEPPSEKVQVEQPTDRSLVGLGLWLKRFYCSS